MTSHAQRGSTEHQVPDKAPLLCGGRLSALLGAIEAIPPADKIFTACIWNSHNVKILTLTGASVCRGAGGQSSPARVPPRLLRPRSPQKAPLAGSLPGGRPARCWRWAAGGGWGSFPAPRPHRLPPSAGNRHPGVCQQMTTFKPISRFGEHQVIADEAGGRAGV